jgi:glycosyltransferase involved in cell wall biosynthesis
MIVKNEEACLERCLKSVCDHVDEIIIVDTGSTDGTVEIAKSYGARIYHHPWENDFSKHRNQSLSYATGGWIFQLDADEELFPED